MSEDEPGGASGGPPALLHTSLLYQRLEALGLSGHVRCWFLRKLDGSAGAVVVGERSAFLTALRATGRFCEDSSRGSMLHGGHRSFREMATGSGDALHVTAAAGDYLRVHLDRVSPSPDATLDGRCRYRSRQAVAHIRRDVVPLLLHPPAAVSGSRGSGKRPRRPRHPSGKRQWLREAC
ncbi:MAG TPA: hypothetical protein VKJ83_06895 [Actinomycetota bacterium]|nr:hypothetical protein [Actinomycetota bacterium]